MRDTWLARLGRALRPEWAEERERLARLESQIARLDTLAPAKSVEQLTRHVFALRRGVGSHLRVTARALKAAEVLDEQDVLQHTLDGRVSRALSRGAVLAGPWTGEVGFELLYWIPFLRQLRSRIGDAAVHAVTRGGSGVWYGGIADSVVDAFDLVDVDTFRRETSGETRKQRRVSPFDRRLLRGARERLGPGEGSARRSALIHPSLLYDLLYRYWKDQTPAWAALELLQFERLQPPAGPILASAALPELPRPYVAVRFYFSDAFPDTPSNRDFVARTLRNLAARGHVVALGTPFRPDDHHDADIAGTALAGAGITVIADSMTPSNNLAVQSAVIAGATGFVGTYGGFSYLAPFYDVPSVACYSRATFFPHHLDVARRAFDQIGVRGLTVVNVAEHDLVSAALGGASSR
jgi:hypothetical protein